MIQHPAPAVQPAASLPQWIKPMTIGGILDRALKIYRDYFSLFFLTVVIVQIPSILLALLLADVTKGLFGPMAVAVTIGAVAWLLIIWGTATIIGLGSSAFLGKTPVFQSASARAASVTLSLIWAALVYAFIAFGPIVLIGIISAIAVPAFMKTRNSMAAGITVILLVAAGLWYVVNVAISFILFHQIVVLEDVRGRASLKRSRILIRERTEKGFFSNNVWRLSVILLAIIALQRVIYMLPMLLTIVASLGTLGTHATPMWSKGLAQILQGLAQAFALPISVLALTVFYYDIRIRKEGLDLELRAAALSPRPRP